MLGDIFYSVLWVLTVIDIKIPSEKDSEDFTNSIDVSSSDERNENETIVPAIVVSSNGPHLDQQETLDDVDDEEAFINELMALHPNDDDILDDIAVEDLENVAETVASQSQEVDEVHEIQEDEETIETVVRQTFVKAFLLSL